MDNIIYFISEEDIQTKHNVDLAEILFDEMQIVKKDLMQD